MDNATSTSYPGEHQPADKRPNTEAEEGLPTSKRVDNEIESAEKASLVAEAAATAAKLAANWTIDQWMDSYKEKVRQTPAIAEAFPFELMGSDMAGILIPHIVQDDGEAAAGNDTITVVQESLLSEPMVIRAEKPAEDPAVDITEENTAPKEQPSSPPVPVNTAHHQHKSWFGLLLCRICKARFLSFPEDMWFKINSNLFDLNLGVCADCYNTNVSLFNSMCL